jgi:hypothetical protein
MIVKKRNRNKVYYYYQDYRGPKQPPITTYIGKEENLGDPIPFVKHLQSLFKEEKPNQFFDHKPTKPFDANFLHLIRTLYTFAINDIPRSELEEVTTELFVKYVHSTTAIEGITLNLGETRNLLSDLEFTPLNKPFGDSQAVMNYKQVKAYCGNFHGDLDQRFIKKINLYVMHNLKSESGNAFIPGEYRTTNKRGIPGVAHSRWQEIASDLEDLLSWYHAKKDAGLHPIEIAARFHQRFEEIHPFDDGNGRTGRAILDLMLKREGYPMIFIPLYQRDEYLKALRLGNTSHKKHADFVPLIDFIIKRLCYTLTYLVTKTSLYIKVQSLKKDMFSSSIIPHDLSKEFFRIMEIYRELEEDL